MTSKNVIEAETVELSEPQLSQAVDDRLIARALAGVDDREVEIRGRAARTPATGWSSPAGRCGSGHRPARRG